MTARVLRALAHPRLHIWGHPLARLLRQREPVSLDLDRVLEGAVSAGVALEINCQPDRLDLPDHLLRPARDKGVRFVISTDSHAVHHFDTLAYGVSQARRGWLAPSDVLNTREPEEFLTALRRPA
jgi:DNA polymerase (family 10)